MRQLESPVYTIQDVRDWLDKNKDLPSHTLVWVSPDWGDVAKPLRHMYCEESMQINSYGSEEKCLILDATPEKDVPKEGMGKLTREMP